MAKPKSTIESRFWPKVNKYGPIPTHRPELGSCWIWTGNKLPRKGYGKLWNGSRLTYAHRASWEIHFGPIPDDGPGHHGWCVCHSCDNTSCVRPDHLWLGSIDDDLKDMAAKGRGATGDRSGSRTHPEKICKGSKHGRSKLSEETVREILLTDGTCAAVGLKFNVSAATISLIRIRRIWRHVPDPRLVGDHPDHLNGD